MNLHIVSDDLSGIEIVSLLEHHLADFAEHSPAESMHALDLDALRAPDITFWSAWDGGVLMGCAALKELSSAHAEIKSMRVVDAARGRGVGAALLQHLIDQATGRGHARVSLETGSPDAFRPARRLYARHGFIECEPFGDYTLDPWSVFMTLTIPERDA